MCGVSTCVPKVTSSNHEAVQKERSGTERSAAETQGSFPGIGRPKKAGIPPGKSDASGGIWPKNLMLK